MIGRVPLVAATVAALVLTSCGGDSDERDGAPVPPSSGDGAATATSRPATPATPAPASTGSPTSTTPATNDSPMTSAARITTTSTTTSSTTTTTSSTTSSTTSTVPTTTTTPPLPPGTPAPVPLDLDAAQIVLGTSVEGRPIVAERYGTVGGRRVLVIGVIHGNEDAGVQIVDELRERARAGVAPPGVELWLVESMNPDGQAAQDRHNANQVDLNRNFPLRWGPIGAPGDGQYAGTGPASEPETQAMVSFISQLRPDIALWYHQDANLIIPSSGRDGRIRARYAELTELPIADCCDGGIYTGIAATWARDALAEQESVAFIVELPGGELVPEQVTAHADAVATIASEG